MKRIIYSAVAAALLVTSCQKTDVLNVVEDSIDFSTQVGKLTKADYSAPKYQTLTDQGFRVWAVSDFTSAPHTDGSIYNDMNGLDVEYKDGWGFVNKGKYMWPQSGQYLYFYTISSKKSTWLEDIKTGNMFTTGESVDPVSKLELPLYIVGDEEDADMSLANDDIMVANRIHQHKGTTSEKTTVVTPNFRHTMTKVEFNFKKGAPTSDAASVATTVVLNKVEISPVVRAGNLTVEYAIANEDFAFSWDPIKDNDNPARSFIYTAPQDAYIENGDDITLVPVYNELPEVGSEGEYCKVGNDIYVVAKETVEGVDTFKWTKTDVECSSYSGKVLNSTSDFTNYVTWYMIPQDLEDEQVVTITYEADGKTIVQKFALTVAEAAKDWTEETCVKYNVTIAPHKIVFKPSVDNWVENPDTDMNV